MGGLGKYMFKVICGCAVVVAVLVLALGKTDGISVAGKGVDVGGFSFGATIGYIPRFFDNLKDGREAADSSATPAAAGKKN